MELTFQKSDSIKNLTKALLTFSVKIGKIKKEANNPFFKSKYASLPDIQDAISDPLQESGLVVIQIPDGEGLITMLSHAESGEYIMANSLMQPVKKDPQSMGSAITYQRRYSIAAILNLNIDDDDDGNAASQPAKKEEKPWLNPKTENWDKVSVYLKGGGTISEVKKKYSISKENETKLLEETK